MIGLNAASIGGIIGAEGGSMALNHYANKEQKDSPRYHKLKAMSAGLGATSSTIAAYQLGIRGKGPKVWLGRTAAGLAGIGAGASIYHGVKFNKARATQIAKEKTASLAYHMNTTIPKAVTRINTALMTGIGGYSIYRGYNPKEDDSTWFSNNSKKLGAATTALGLGYGAVTKGFYKGPKNGNYSKLVGAGQIAAHATAPLLTAAHLAWANSQSKKVQAARIAKENSKKR